MPFESNSLVESSHANSSNLDQSSIFSVILKNIIKIFTIKIKPRHDSYADQFNRVFIRKMLIIASVIVGVNWFNDKVNCIVPDSLMVDSNFVSNACWIRGFYIYKDLNETFSPVRYYGIPADISYDGKYENGELCSRFFGNVEDNQCQPMSKSFYLQYQYMPFLLIALALLYHIPYLISKNFNTDMIYLKEALKGADAVHIFETLFNKRMNPWSRQRIRSIMNIFIKTMYIFSNVGCFLATDKILLGNFKMFGLHFIGWSTGKDSVAYHYMDNRGSQKPSNILFPAYGICEVPYILSTFI